MAKAVDIVGQVFGKLTVIERKGNDVRNKAQWLCKCECGKEIVTLGKSLRSGNSTTCGYCERWKRNNKHGGHKTLAYSSWFHMRSRCNNPKDKRFKDYGGRGIKVCDRWLNSFENFLSDMGERPSKAYSLDRIDVDRNYTPGNCRWSTAKEQRNNRRDSKSTADTQLSGR